jgi:two-component sensor histidine kinase
MVRRIASLTVPLKLLIFLGGILFATLVLAIIGFRSLKNEGLREEKDYENARVNLKNAVMEISKIKTEETVENIEKYVKNEDFLKDSMPGVLSIFVFSEGDLLIPKINEDKVNETYLLESSDAFALKEFLDLQKAKMFAEAREYALRKVDFFLQNPSLARLNWESYFLEKMLNDILSEENLSKENSEKFWKKLNEIKWLLQNLNTYKEHRDFLIALGNYASYVIDKHFFIQNEAETFLAISYSESATRNLIIAKMDSAFYSNKINMAINETAKEWSYIPFSISGDFPFGEWSMATEEYSESVKKETQKKIYFLYLMLVFSLVIPMIGVVVVYRVFSSERQLRLMKDNFLSTISHELKTPLTSIKMFSELIVQRPEKKDYYTGVILKETNRLESLIDAILSYTRMESGKKVFRWESVNLSECAEKVCASLDVIASGKGLEIKREIATDCTIVGDYQSIYSLVQNLVDNAIKYTAAGYVFVKLQQDSQKIYLSVEDTGKGIPANEQKNIFEGFYRIGDESTRETKGTGLGLAIVKRTADEHKAAIILKSAPGKGSTFTVVFNV